LGQDSLNRPTVLLFPAVWVGVIGASALGTASLRFTAVRAAPSQVAFFLLALGVMPLFYLAAVEHDAVSQMPLWVPLRRVGVLSYLVSSIRSLAGHRSPALAHGSSADVAKRWRSAAYLELPGATYVLACLVAAAPFRSIEQRLLS
jgi:hypothetical protein